MAAIKRANEVMYGSMSLEAERLANSMVESSKMILIFNPGG